MRLRSKSIVPGKTFLILIINMYAGLCGILLSKHDNFEDNNIYCIEDGTDNSILSIFFCPIFNAINIIIFKVFMRRIAYSLIEQLSWNYFKTFAKKICFRRTFVKTLFSCSVSASQACKLQLWRRLALFLTSPLNGKAAIWLNGK